MAVERHNIHIISLLLVPPVLWLPLFISLLFLLIAFYFFRVAETKNQRQKTKIDNIVSFLLHFRIARFIMNVCQTPATNINIIQSASSVIHIDVAVVATIFIVVYCVLAFLTLHN